MLRLSRFLLLAGLLPGAWAQQSYPFFSPSPSPPLLVTATANSPFGQSSYCYWVVVVYPIGKSTPSAPSCVPNAIETSSVLISWSAASGASSYDVLRTTTPILPNVTSNIAVATAVSGTTQTDSFGALSSYTIASAVPATANLYLDNTAFSTPQLRAIVTGVGGTTAFNLGSGGGGTPGGVNGQVQFNNAGAFGGFTVSGDGTLNTGTGVLTVTQVNGAAVPTSAKLISTNASNQLVAAAASTAPVTVSATGGIACSTCATTTNGGALSATSPTTISAAGVIACATCATTTNGGALSATSPTTISAAGVIACATCATTTNGGALSATSPATISAAGVIACATCATTTNGGALSATSPTTISAAGVIACATCATTTNGGALSATSPVTISAAGVIACSACLTTVPWNTVANPTGNLSLTMGADTSLFTFNAATGAGVDLFELTDTTNNTGTGNLLRSSTSSGSAAAPFRADANGIGFQVNSSGNWVNLSTANIINTQNNLTTTETDFLVMTNTTAATNAVKQQFSPRARWSGTAWLNSGSQTIEWWADVQGPTTNPSANGDDALVFSPRINGSAPGTHIALCATTIGVFIVGLDGAASQAECNRTVDTFVGLGSANGAAANVFAEYTNGAENLNFNNNGMNFGSGKLISWSSSADPTNATTGDTGLCRNAAAGLLSVNDGSTTCTNFRDIEIRSVVSGGSVPGISGCTAGTQVGGNTAGSYASGTTGTCTVTLTFAKTAPNGWVCNAEDTTTPADAQHQSATSTTTCTITGTTVSGDVITFAARAY